MTNKFRAEVNSAVEYLDDSTPLTTKSTWYRQSERSNLHYTRRCSKLNHNQHQLIEVDLTPQEASLKKTCFECVSLRKVLPDATRFAVLTISSINDQLLLIHKNIETNTMTSIGESLSIRDTINELIKSVSDSSIVSVARTKAERSVKDVSRRLSREATKLCVDAPSWAARALMRSQVSYNEKSIPGTSEADIVIFGPNMDKTDSRDDYILSRIYRRWNINRKKSKDAADAAALVLARDASLQTQEQLNFITVLPGTEVSFKEWIETVWRNKMHTVLTEQLLVAWEQNYQDLSARTRLRLVGIVNSSYRSHATRTIIEAYSGFSKNDTSLILVPEVVALFISAAEKKWYSDIVEIAPACQVNALETVAVLWEPGVENSAYFKLSAASVAAKHL